MATVRPLLDASHIAPEAVQHMAAFHPEIVADLTRGGDHHRYPLTTRCYGFEPEISPPTP